MKLCIADRLSSNAVKALEALGAELELNADLTAEQLPEAIGDAEILIVRSTKVSGETIRAGRNLSLIIRAGAGVNTIDLETASSLGVQVANCPGKNADAVAELTIGLMIALDRRIVDNAVDLRNGAWNKKRYSKARGLKGRTLGILGCGAIGQKTAAVASAMGMEVAVWSRSLTQEKAAAAGMLFCSSPEELAERSDVISIHLALTAETRGMVNAAFLKHVRPGAYIINTSRGEVVNTADLQAAMLEKGLRVALDVYENEPGASDSRFDQIELAALITGTHHIGASTEQAADAIADEVVAIVDAYRTTGKPLHQVNARERSSAAYNLVVRHFNKVGVLAAVLDQLRSARINVEEMENSIFSTGKAALCTLKLDEKPDNDVIAAIAAMEEIIQVALK